MYDTQKREEKPGTSGGSLLTYIPPPPFILPPVWHIDGVAGGLEDFTCKLLAQLARSLSLFILEYDSRFFFYLGGLVFGYLISWSGFFLETAG